MKKSTIYMTLAFLLSIAMIILISLLAYNRIQNLMHYSERVEHTYQVQLGVAEIFVNLRSAVGAQRGYLLSGDTAYLRGYHTHRANTYTEFQKVDSLVADNPVQKRNLDTLHRLLEQRLAVLDAMIAAYGSSPHKNRIFQQDSQADKSTTIQFLKKLADMRTEEERLMQGRITYKNASERAVPIFLLVLIMLALVFLSLSLVFLRRELKRRLAVQQELEEKVEALDVSNRELEQFAYVASHDLNEPLRKIMTFGTMLKTRQKDRLDAEGNRLLDTITSLSSRMRMLIDDLLTFSQMVNSKIPLATTNLNQVLQQVLQDLSETIEQKQATVTITQLPCLLAYSSQIHQLFQNIIANSLKYSRSGVPPVITISSTLINAQDLNRPGYELTEKKFHKILFQDNGIGFEQKYAEQIFTIFQRLHAAEKYSGTGIGLAICKRIVTNHSGYIEAVASLNKGATFVVYLPALQENK